jgi:Ni/Fe-hydrogenase subunit HybB-like protein
MKNNKILTFKTILWFITGIASTVMIFRLVKGLGISTNLSDKTPWGLWIGFDVFSGVALAAGGFIVCAIVYIFHLEKYRPLARPAVLTAFLGYIAVAIGLFFDLGIPWRIWHPTIYWQPHSALFEVAWCVMLYLTVLLLEFSPVVLEKIPSRPFQSILRFLKRFTIVFVLLGIMLSVLHQSSLGTLFMLMPSRLHPLWYSSIQPLLFFISAIALGMAMVTLESLIISWLYNRQSEEKILSNMGRFIPLVLGLYFIFRIGELYYKGHLGISFDGTWPGFLFIFELLISTIIPIILFSVKPIRERKAGLLIAASMVVFGFIFHRIDVGIISSFQTTGELYFPSLIEIVTSLGLVSIAVLVFLFFVEHFSVYKTETVEDTDQSKEFDIVTNGRLFDAGLGKERRYSFVYILGASLAIFILPSNGLWHISPEATPVQSARVINADSLTISSKIDMVNQEEVFNPLQTTKTLLIDGNRNNRSVIFTHDRHIQNYTKTLNCGFCHHMNLTTARVSQCSKCHRDMFLESDIFNHIDHIIAEGGNDGCIKCHVDPNVEKNRVTSTPCSSCHKSMKVSDSFIKIETNWTGIATGYMQAMHGLCLTCHEQKEEAAGKVRRTGISNCSTCHKDQGTKLYAITKPELSVKEIR